MSAPAKDFCCTTPRAIFFWTAAFLFLYAGGLLLMRAWPTLRPYEESLLFAALGVACVANFSRNRSFHCSITGPLFLVAGALVAARVSDIWRLPLDWLWPAVLVGVGIALLLEIRLARAQRAAGSKNES